MKRLPLLAYAFLLSWNACSSSPMASAADPAVPGVDLYQRHCAVCHGVEGDADTMVAGLLLPRPTAFRDGRFKLVSTTNGQPTEHDLIASLRRGLPGSTMMSYGWLPDDDLRALAGEVMRLTRLGRAASIQASAAAAGAPLGDDDAAALAARLLTAGATIDTGGDGPLTAARLDDGRRLYTLHCADCHGADGRGLPVANEWPTDGSWLWPRDFTAGYLRGGSSHHELALRLRAGMPGAHMPAVALSRDETAALTSYVRGMIPTEAADHHVQWRRTVRVPRVATLAGEPADGAGLEAVRLPLAPLRWRQDAATEVLLRAAHDGHELVLQLDWADATRDDHVVPGQPMGDGAAVQFATGDEAPLFTMGSPTSPVNVWRWHAYDPAAVAGLMDLLTRPPHASLDSRTPALPAPRCESILLHGPASSSSAAGSGLPLRVSTAWHDGRWTVTFRRALAARGAGEVALVSPPALLFALAVWDGSRDRSPASKSITTWHRLELAP
ncbi:MAG: c-type cytochrome [Planctomycetes bacterium]|nr:c-type cytochrome [Planctomycetota bacterium]